jgi:hypothetical protein
MNLTILPFSQRPDLEDSFWNDGLMTAWPNFMLQDPTANLVYAPKRFERFLEFTLVAFAEQNPNEVLARAVSIPYAEKAFVDIAKLRDYCLNPVHPVGKHKAKVFVTALGLTSSDATFLQGALLESAKTSVATQGMKDEYGQSTVDFSMQTDKGNAIVRSAWVMLVDEDFPRLVSCYVL